MPEEAGWLLGRREFGKGEFLPAALYVLKANNYSIKYVKILSYQKMLQF